MQIQGAIGLFLSPHMGIFMGESGRVMINDALQPQALNEKL